jgi:predicted TIM-barrel fold metal-dependent hydrolase
MRIIDFHVHLATPGIAARDPVVEAVRRSYGRVRGLLPAPARAALELAGGAAAPIERRARDRALALADRALALGRNRAMYLGRLGERLARGAEGLLEASFLRATPRNLLDDMDAAGVAAAVVLPVPPHTTTDEVLAMCERDASGGLPRLLPFCCPVPGQREVGGAIAAWKARGCRGVKMHPTIHACPPSDPFYHEVAEAAQALSLPVVAHTGELDVGEDPAHAALSRALAYEPLLRAFPRVRFVLAHMNLFRADEAIELALRHENVLLDTSWQPAGVVRRARRRLGDRRILFASDWPFLGSHLSTLLDIAAEGLDRKPDAIERVFGRNAEDLLSSAC